MAQFHFSISSNDTNTGYRMLMVEKTYAGFCYEYNMKQEKKDTSTNEKMAMVFSFPSTNLRDKFADMVTVMN